MNNKGEKECINPDIKKRPFSRGGRLMVNPVLKSSTLSEPTKEKEGQAILVVSFGTTYKDTGAVTIDAIEKKMIDTFGAEYAVKRAFTAQRIINKLAKRDGLKIDNVEEALQKLIAEGIKTLIVQPTHVMHGTEYDDLAEVVNQYADQFDNVVIGEPLLTSFDDYEQVTAIMKEVTADQNEAGTAIVLMGHGTPHFANATYACFQTYLQHKVGRNYFVGTVEGYPTIQEVIEDLSLTEAKKVVLYPFMIVAGDHANNDMAGDGEDSWARQLKKQGYEVHVVLKGLGQYEAIQLMYIKHAQAAMEQLGL